MIYKISVTLCDLPINIFLPNGFFEFSTKPSHLHRHRYTEVQVIFEGEAVYSIGPNKYILNKGDFFIIPPHKMHSCVSVSSDIKHSSFLIDHNISSEMVGSLPANFVDEFLHTIPYSLEKEDYFGLMGYFSLILSKIVTNKKIIASDISDDSFVIDNYIEKHYADSPMLSDLALRLRRSEKQTARLVWLYYGMSFSDLIIQKRMRIAQHLKNTTDMSLKDISEYVGYSSYSGFYKAYTKFKKETGKYK